MAVLYFPAIRDSIYHVCENQPVVKPIDLIEEWVEIVEPQINPVQEIHFEHTIEANNIARRAVMNCLTEFSNALICYQACIELLRRYDSELLSDPDAAVNAGERYYQAANNGAINPDQAIRFEDVTQLVDQGIFNVKDVEKIDYIKTSWVASA